MKPSRIFLVRHGESEGNASRAIYSYKPDYAIGLTKKGQEQAIKAGINLRSIIGEQSVQFYVSSFHRTRQTFEEISKSFDKSQYCWREDIRLREQEWSGSLPIDAYSDIAEKERNGYGTFYYRFKGGESCADVYLRLGDFLGTIHRDFQKPLFPNNAIFVAHGMSLRVLLMRWFHWTVEEFELLRNPKNCEIIQMNLNPLTNKYELISPLKRYEKHSHPYQYNIGV